IVGLNFIADVIGGVLLKGYLTLGICIVGILATIGADFRALLRVPANIRPSAMKIEKFPSWRWWALERISRRMGYSYFRFMIATDQFKETAAVQYIAFREFAIAYHRSRKSSPGAPAAPEEARPAVFHGTEEPEKNSAS